MEISPDKYPIQSTHGNQYVLVIYHYDANAILVTALKNREKTTIKQGYKKLHQRLTNCGCQPRLQVMDNEVSAILKNYYKDNGITLQLAPPEMHRQNAAERAIRTFKDHFIAVRSTCDPAFPARLLSLIHI